MSKVEQLSLFDCIETDEKTIEQPKETIDEYPSCDFDSLFITKEFEEIHNQHSMTILGNCIDVMRSVEIIGENRTDRTCPGGVVISTDKASRERRGGRACKIAKWMTGGIFTF